MPKPGQSNALFPALLHTSNEQVQSVTPPEPNYPARERTQTATQLWLALRFPALTLEARGALNHDASPVAVIEERSGALRVCAVNAAAGDQGIDVGAPLSAAYALVPDLLTLERDPARELARLERLAAWCVQFTSSVSVTPPDTLLLDIHGSLKLFDGLAALLGQVDEALNALQLVHLFAVAPTSLAALWFVRHQASLVLDDPARLSDALACLPLRVTRWPERSLRTLAGMGVYQVGDALRLPRDGFARRFGRERRLDLDRALGQAPDPRTPFVQPPVFCARLDLLTETDRLVQIEHAAGRLIDELAGVLLGHQRAVAQFELQLVHRDAPVTIVSVGLAEPACDAIRLRRVMHERIERLVLGAPVMEVILEARRLELLSGRDGDLFSRSVAGYDWPHLVETLRARLGARSVYGLCLVPEHRPEAVFRYVEPGINSVTFARPPRPLWMLTEPSRLETANQWPVFDGTLQILRGPERIETGWWDGKDVARDYYIAQNSQQLFLWVYRRRHEPKDWYLHGVFA